MDDAGEIHAFGRSLRQESTVWSRGVDDVFSRSSRDEDDEEALRWAALEKLPTYDRARTAVLAMPEGELKEVNVHKLGSQEMHALMQRVAWVGDEHERFLSKFKDRVNRVGVELPMIEVRYQNLNVEAEAYLGSRGLPSIPNTYANVLEVLNAYVIRHTLELDVNVGTSLLYMYCKCGVTASAEAMFATMPTMPLCFLQHKSVYDHDVEGQQRGHVVAGEKAREPYSITRLMGRWCPRSTSASSTPCSGPAATGIRSKSTAATRLRYS